MSKRSRERALRRRHAGNASRGLTLSRQELHVGPLPKPETLAAFDEVLPGLAERVVKMAEGNHTDRLRTNRAMRFVAIAAPMLGFILAMTVVVGGLWLIYAGKDVAGFGAIGTAIGAILAAFWKARKTT